MNAGARQAINGLLRGVGLAPLEDAGLLMHQLGYFVRDHDHFRSLLTACEPAFRTDMYEALAANLRFPAKPLDEYLARAAENADAKQLPQWHNDTQTFTPYRTAEVRTLDAALARAVAKFELTVTCRRCTKQAKFYGTDQYEAVRALRDAGWTWDELTGDAREICPEC